jgi:hypothetical protein
MGMPEPLVASDVAIRTAQVEIRILTVNLKQMTLAVFRQLPLRGDHELLNGWVQPWGWVNYHIGCRALRDEDGDTPEHIHVVCEGDGRLWHVLFTRDPQHVPPRSVRRLGDPPGLVREGATQADVEAFKHRWYEKYEEVESLGQLFIAV